MEIQVSEEISSEYLAEVQYILADREFLSLGEFVHHQWTNRLMHSINVSYLSGIADLLKAPASQENGKAAGL